MPNRILREGILTSEEVARLSWPSNVFYRSLMSIADDYGRCSANVKLLRAALYPFQLDKVSESDIEKWMLETAKAALIRLYSVDGKDYLEIEKFNQQIRSKSKFPAPPDSEGNRNQPPVNETTCNQLIADDINCKQMRTKAYSYSETKSKKKETLSKSLSLPESLNTPEFTELWEKWERHWCEKGTPLTSSQKENHFIQLVRMKSVSRAIAAVENSLSVAKTPKIFEPFENTKYGAQKGKVAGYGLIKMGNAECPRSGL